jgi:uncharacterized membrane protein
VWRRGSVTILPSLGGTGTEARAVSDAGVIAGDLTTTTGEVHAVIWTR